MALGTNLLWRTGWLDPWRDGIRLEALPAPAGVEALFLPVGAFAVAERHRPPLADFLDRFTEAAAGEFGLWTEVFLQGNHLHKGDSAAVLSSHGREWIPLTGLGVWPDREPPRLLNWKDLVFKLPGMAPRTLMYNLYRISTGDTARRQARGLMAGRGLVLQVMGPGSPEQFFDKGREVLLPPIQEPTFRSFPYYVPLLERKTAGQAGLEQWLCGAVVYLRESPEDDGVVIVSRRPLAGVLEKIGARRGPKGWSVPAAGRR